MTKAGPPHTATRRASERRSLWTQRSTAASKLPNIIALVIRRSTSSVVDGLNRENSFIGEHGLLGCWMFFVVVVLLLILTPKLSPKPSPKLPSNPLKTSSTVGAGVVLLSIGLEVCCCCDGECDFVALVSICEPDKERVLLRSRQSLLRVLRRFSRPHLSKPSKFIMRSWYLTLSSVAKIALATAQKTESKSSPLSLDGCGGAAAADDEVVLVVVEVPLPPLRSQKVDSFWQERASSSRQASLRVFWRGPMVIRSFKGCNEGFFEEAEKVTRRPPGPKETPTGLLSHLGICETVDCELWWVLVVVMMVLAVLEVVLEGKE